MEHRVVWISTIVANFQNALKRNLYNSQILSLTIYDCICVIVNYNGTDLMGNAFVAKFVQVFIDDV